MGEGLVQGGRETGRDLEFGRVGSGADLWPRVRHSWVSSRFPEGWPHPPTAWRPHHAHQEAVPTSIPFDNWGSKQTLKCLSPGLDSLLTSCGFLEDLKGKGCAKTPQSPLVARPDVLGIGPRRLTSGREGQMPENVLTQPSSQQPEG